MKKWVLVSGGSRGIGRAIIHHLADIGYNVIFTYKSSDENAESLCDHIKEKGSQCLSFKCDMSVYSEVSDLKSKIISEGVEIYAIVNNAGIVKDSIMLNMSSDGWSDVLNTNLTSVFNVINIFLKDLIFTDGFNRIVNISSVTAIKGNIGQVNYAASKSALTGFTKSLSLELAPFSINVNNILPGFIETDMVEGVKDKSKILKSIPLKKFGKPIDVALMVGFLLGDGGGYITGQDFIIDGGMSI